MKRRISIRHVLLSAIALFVLAEVSYADPLVIVTGPGMNTFMFQNAHATTTATDFRVVLISVPPPAIGGGFGGAPFPVATTQLPAQGGGFLRIIYDGGPGIAPGGIYTHSFPDWPIGTRFDVQFSYLIGGQLVLMDPVLVEPTAFNFPGEGATSAVPEPATLILLGTGIVGVALKARRRRTAGKQ
jgi:hypothetical protein